MTRPRDAYGTKVFSWTFKAGEYADIGGIGCIRFYEATRVEWTVPRSLKITPFRPDDGAPSAIPLPSAEEPGDQRTAA